MEFSESFDARDWANAFVEHVTKSPTLATDEETMVSWFANAIMRGFDEHARRYDANPLIHAVAKFDYEVRTKGMADPLTLESVLKLGLAFARPHVDPDGYANDLRAAGAQVNVPPTGGTYANPATWATEKPVT